MKQEKKKIRNELHGKSIDVYDKNGLVLIMHCKDVYEAAHSCGISPEGIYRQLLKNAKKGRRYVFRYTDVPQEEI